MKLAIVVGHTLNSPGAASRTLLEMMPRLKHPAIEARLQAGRAQRAGIYEREFNGELAARIQAVGGDQVRVFFRDGQGVAGAYAQAKAWGATGVVELHFNSAAEPSAHGTETLWAQPGSKRLAQAVQRAMVGALGLTDRGAKTPWNGRGETNLNALPGVPSIITEAFFGSNADDSRVAAERLPLLAEAIVAGAREGLSWA